MQVFAGVGDNCLAMLASTRSCWLLPNSSLVTIISFFINNAKNKGNNHIVFTGKEAMNLPVLVNNLQDKVSVDDGLEQLLAGVVAEALCDSGLAGDPEISLVFVDDDYIAGLNQRYRGVEGPTDVLSFAMQEGDPMPGGEEEDLILGDVVISLETARRQAGEYGHSFEREAAYLAIHGVLHLLGYDHGNEPDRQKMREREEAVLARIGVGR